MPYCGIFGIEFWKTIVIFEVNTLKFVKIEFLIVNTVNKGSQYVHCEEYPNFTWFSGVEILLFSYIFTWFWYTHSFILLKCNFLRRASQKNYVMVLGQIYQPFTKHLRLTLVFMWNNALWEKFDLCFSRVFC